MSGLEDLRQKSWETSGSYTYMILGLSQNIMTDALGLPGRRDDAKASQELPSNPRNYPGIPFWEDGASKF